MNPRGDGASAITASITQRIRFLLRSMPPTHPGLSHGRGSRELFEQAISNEALIDATQRFHESLQDAVGFPYDRREILQ